MKYCKTVKELRREFDDVKDGCSGDTIFSAKAIMFLATILDEYCHKSIRAQNRTATLLEQILKALKKKKRIPSPYQLKVAEFLRAGKPIQEAHRLAKEEK